MQFNDIDIMEIDALPIKDDSNYLNDVKKPDLRSRLQPTQLEMDWLQDCWTRSIHQVENNLQITLHFPKTNDFVNNTHSSKKETLNFILPQNEF